MIKNIFRGMCLLVISCLAVLFSSCSQQTEDQLFGKSQYGLSQEQKDEIYSLLYSEEFGRILPLPLFNDYARANKLSQEEFKYAQNLVAASLAEGFAGNSQFKEWTEEERLDYANASVLALNDMSLALFKLPLYKLSSDDEVGKVIDMSILSQFQSKLRYANLDRVKKFIQDKIDDELAAQQLRSSTLRSSGDCPKYYYTTKSSYSNSNSGIRCISYDNATNSVDSDCDYEFSFPWNRQYCPPSLALCSPNWLLSGVLGLGGIYGRFHNNYSSTSTSSYNTVSFLIGKGRLEQLGFTPQEVLENLYINE